MRIDIVTIFPEFFSVLDVSLLGKARTSGLLDLGVHDLRDFTHDRHRTVDDTPYGGGAGMVMKPEPWGEAFDDILGIGNPSIASIFSAVAALYALKQPDAPSALAPNALVPANLKPPFPATNAAFLGNIFDKTHSPK
ncbi:MAG: tRNA (guanine37-N1)-methyltransferase, partial [Actinomycetota bacterium]|nr:tRNA (guanine37-N1)-methyltransferase [Actinomycetota bacterium]